MTERHEELNAIAEIVITIAGTGVGLTLFVGALLAVWVYTRDGGE